jgi:hypothetical protein
MLTLCSVASIKMPEHMSVRHGNDSLPCTHDHMCHHSTCMACTPAGPLIDMSDHSGYSPAKCVDISKHLEAFEAGALAAQGIHQGVVANWVMVCHFAPLAACEVDMGLVFCRVQASAYQSIGQSHTACKHMLLASTRWEEQLHTVGMNARRNQPHPDAHQESRAVCCPPGTLRRPQRQHAGRSEPPPHILPCRSPPRAPAAPAAFGAPCKCISSSLLKYSFFSEQTSP